MSKLWIEPNVNTFTSGTISCAKLLLERNTVVDLSVSYVEAVAVEEEEEKLPR